MTLHWKRIKYQSYVVPSSLPKAGIIFFAISSFCKHILASVRTESAYNVIFIIEHFVRKIIYLYFFSVFPSTKQIWYLNTCIFAVGLKELFIGSEATVSIASFLEVKSSLSTPFFVLDFFVFPALYVKK